MVEVNCTRNYQRNPPKEKACPVHVAVYDRSLGIFILHISWVSVEFRARGTESRGWIFDGLFYSTNPTPHQQSGKVFTGGHLPLKDYSLVKAEHDVVESGSSFPVLGTSYKARVFSLAIGHLRETKEIKVALCWLDTSPQSLVSLSGYFTRLEGTEECLSWGRLRARRLCDL